MSWLKGKRGYDAAEEKIEQISQEMANRVYRLWLKPEGETTVVFVDDDPPIIEEHQFNINGSWTNWATCLGVIGEPCKACEGDQAYTVGFYTIIEMVDFTTKDGTHVVNPRRVLGAKYTLLKNLKKEREIRGGSLVGCMYRVSRTDGGSSNTGDEWEFIRKLSAEEIQALSVDGAGYEPLDFEEYLKPKTPAEMEKMVGRATDKDNARAGGAAGGGSKPGETTYNEDDIDF